MQLLLNNGADVYIQTKNGGSPLYIATKNGFHEIERILLEYISTDIILQESIASKQ